MIWLLVEYGGLAMFSRLEHIDAKTRIPGYYKEHKLSSQCLSIQTVYDPRPIKL